MALEERTKEILKNLHDAVVDYDRDKVEEWSSIAKDEGADAYLCVMEGLAAGMHTVGDMYEDKVYFVPEVLMCSDALYAGLDVLRPLIPKGAGKVIGAVVIGVLEGDVHDIGKNLVKMMFDVAGWTVYDLGRDVEITKFAAEQLRTDAEMVALSAMMTTSMMGMPKVIKIIKERNPDVQIIIGGSPITEDTVAVFGADGYAPSAANAVDEAVKMIDHLRKLREERGSL
jgi:methanogenic corrinoid protein MtbC1